MGLCGDTAHPLHAVEHQALAEQYGTRCAGYRENNITFLYGRPVPKAMVFHDEGRVDLPEDR